MLGGLVIGLSLWVTTVSAQETVPPETQAAIPADALERGTPLGSISGFLIAAGKQDFELAAEYLDLRNLPDDVSVLGGIELARQLNFILSRSVTFNKITIDDTPSGEQGDGLPEFRDELARIQFGDDEVALFLQHVPRGDGAMIWKISNRSVALVPSLYEEFSYPPWIEAIRKKLPQDTSFLGLEAYKWVITLGFGLLAWPIAYFGGRLLARLMVSREKPIYPTVRKLMTGPAAALVIVIVMVLVLKQLGLGAVAQQYANARTVSTIVVVWFMWSLLGLYRHYKQERLLEEGRPGASRLMQPLTNFVKLLVLLVGALFWLSNVGVNISTVLAGLGVGGLALALALQKPIEDLMGALTLFSQQPVRVGDFCKYGNVVGEVEDIGLRTTRIRTLANTLVSVPNSKIALSDIENYSAREKFHYRPVLRLRYDCSTEQLRNIIDDVREMLIAHPRVLDEPMRVRFTDFADDAILVKVHCYLNAESFPEFLEIAEKLNLNIMEVVEAQEASFALPGRMIYEATPQTIQSA